MQDAPSDASPARQTQLFPQAFEARADALEALAQLDVSAARSSVERARASGAVGADLAELERALEWLAARGVARGLPLEAVADLFLALPTALRERRISRAGLEFIDDALARYGLPGGDTSRRFLDADARVHLGALHLARDNPERAHALLHDSLHAGFASRADLWGYLGDARSLGGDPEGANESYVRALVLDAQAVDLWRTKHGGIAQGFGALLRDHAEDVARERLLVEVWLAGSLTLPPGDRWLEPADCMLAPDAALRADARRQRRFTHLFCLDRSRPRGTACSIEGREEMEQLEPRLFERCLVAIRRTENAGQRGSA